MLAAGKFWAIPVAAVILLLVAVSILAETSATVHVRATIRPFLDFAVQQKTATYRVSSEDIRKGYVDLPLSIVLSVKTNIGSPVSVSIEGCRGELVLVRERGSRGSFSATYAIEPSRQRRGFSMEALDCRVFLSRDTREGIYPLSIRLVPGI